MGRAQISGTDPGSYYPRQGAPPGAQIITSFIKVFHQLDRGNRLIGEMQKEQVLKIDPYFCHPAAGIRAPWTRYSAQIVQARENRHQLIQNTIGETLCPLQCRAVEMDEMIHRLIGFTPNFRRSPQRQSLRKIT